jgi:hypothetical protein
MDEQLEIIRLLLEHGADSAVTDAAGRTPRDWAKNERLVAMLRAGSTPAPGARERTARKSAKARRRRPTQR